VRGREEGEEIEEWREMLVPGSAARIASGEVIDGALEDTGLGAELVEDPSLNTSGGSTCPAACAALKAMLGSP